MRFEIDFERVYPHSPERVWRAITTQAEIALWLMENDFVAEAGRQFKMWCEDTAGGTDTYLCEVLEIDPPRRMAWSWVLDGRQKDGPTRVEFTLEAVEDGTLLAVRHSGDRDRETVERFKGGWPVKLDQLKVVLQTGNLA